MTTGPHFDTTGASANARLLKYYVVTALFVFATALSPFLGDDNRNFLLIGFMLLSPIFIGAPRITMTIVVLFFYLASIALFPPIVNPEHVRWSTVLFTMMFAISFVSYENALRTSRMDIDLFTKTVRILLLAHFAVFVVQQVSVLTGLPILNASNYSEQAKWKLNALSAEASHAARIVNILMFAYLSLQEIRSGGNYSLRRQFRKDRYVWLGYIWMSITMQSATALLLLPIMLFKIIGLRDPLLVLGLALIVGLTLSFTEVETFDRVYTLARAAMTLDYQVMLEADHSGSLRIAPLFLLTGMVDLSSFQGWFGHGIDTVSSFLSDWITGIERGTTGGGMMMVWYEYGFVSFALYVIFSIRVASALRSVANFTFWLLLVFLVGPNNQMAWMFLMVRASISYFERSAVSMPRARHSMIVERDGNH